MDPHTPLISSSPVSASGSPPLRSTILGSFLGRSNRTRNSSSQQRDRDREMSPPANLAPPLVSPPSVQPIPSSNPNPVPIINNPIPPNPTPPSSSSFRLRLVPHLDSRRSLRFDPITRDMRAGDPVLRIGRFTDRSGQNQNQNGGYNNNNPNSFKMAFKSKVVSRTHAELWVECSPSSDTGSSPQPKFFVRDTSSSSGTFINHVRLSAANTASRPFQIRDGDILQLGVDYQGGSEDIYKCVKIRVEVGRDWMRTRNEYNAIAMKNLKSLAQSVNNAATPSSSTKKKAKFSGAGLPDCCICLCSLTPFQPLFVSPCSHTFHYKCIRPLIEKHYPGFCCPLCRTYGDLEEDVEVELEEEIGDVEDGVENHAGLAGGDDVDVDIDASDERRRVGLGGGVEDGDGDGDRQEGEDHELEEVGDPGEGYVDPRVEEEDGRGKRKMGVAHQRLRNLRVREPQYGGETEVESDAGAAAGGSAIRGAQRRGRGHGHARNTSLSAQIDPMPAAAEGMDEDEDEEVREFGDDDEGEGGYGGVGERGVGDGDDVDVDVDMISAEGEHGSDGEEEGRGAMRVEGDEGVGRGVGEEDEDEDEEVEFVDFGAGGAGMRARGLGGDTLGARERRK